MFFRVVLCLSLAVPGLVQAQQYRWLDEKGQVRYSDRPPPATAKDVRKQTEAAPPASGEVQVPFELQKAQADFPVTLYTAPICKQPCTLAREALNKRGVPFKEVQVWNQETLDQLKALAASDSVPALVVGRSVQSGYDAARFTELLDSAGYPKQGDLPVRAQAAPPPPEGYEPPPVAEPVAAPGPPQKPGPYDPSGLKGPVGPAKPAPRLYDPSGLTSTTVPKPGIYRLPGEEK